MLLFCVSPNGTPDPDLQRSDLDVAALQWFKGLKMHKMTEYLFTLKQALEKKYTSILFNIFPRVLLALPKHSSKLPEKLSGIRCMYKRAMYILGDPIRWMECFTYPWVILQMSIWETLQRQLQEMGTNQILSRPVEPVCNHTMFPICSVLQNNK